MNNDKSQQSDKLSSVNPKSEDKFSNKNQQSQQQSSSDRGGMKSEPTDAAKRSSNN